MTDLARSPITSAAPVAADEVDLWRAARSGSAGARESLFARYTPYARQVAGRLFRERARGDLDVHELRQLAYVGLLEAIDRFDPDRGVPFRGYAARRIAGSILDGIAHINEKREQLAYRARVRSERIRSLADADTESMSATDAMAALAELATGLALGFMLDSGLVATEETADLAPSAYDGIAWRETVQRLFSAIDMLTEREQFIIRQHYLNGVSFHLIADLLGVTKGRVSQLHKAVMARLRRQLAVKPEFAFE